MMEQLKQANSFLMQEQFAKALEIYLLLKNNLPVNELLDLNIHLCKSRLAGQRSTASFDNKYQNKQNSKLTKLSLGQSLKNFGIEQIYVLNLKRRPDRKIKILKEFAFNGIVPKFIEAIDGKLSIEASEKYKQFMARKVGSCKSSSHIPVDKQRMYKRNLNNGVFAYMLSQKLIIEDAIREKYKKICIFDDDVFFTDSASAQIKELNELIPHDWQIIMLGASEYGDVSNYVHERLYHPIAGKTCGSFGVMYQSNIFQFLLESISEYDGTFDNVVLGHAFSQYQTRCFVINPNVCIPDVTESDIRSDSRDQNTQALRMRWDIANLSRWNTPVSLSVVFSSKQSLKYILDFNDKFAADISVIFYYHSVDGLRPVIPSFSYTVDDELFDLYNSISLLNEQDARDKIIDIGVPYSDLVVFWPYDEVAITELMLQNIVIQAYQTSNSVFMDGIFGAKIFKQGGKQPVKNLHSIIIPSYRDPTSIMPSIISALSQERVSFEVVVVNDNPELENFVSILNQEIINLQDKKIISEIIHLKIIQHKKRRFAAGARNTGLLASSGEFISFLDDDDIYHSQRLTCVESELTLSDSSIGACFCGYSGAWNGKYDESRFRVGNLQFDILALNYVRHYMNTDTVTYKRFALNRLGGFNESYIRHQDIELNLRFFDVFDVVNTKKIGVTIRPNVVEPTFNDNYEALLELKVKLLKDFSYLIQRLDTSKKIEVIQNHANDVLKRIKLKTDQTNDIICAFLRKIVNFDINMKLKDLPNENIETQEGESRALEYLEMGHTHFKNGDYINAIKLYEDATIHRPFQGYMSLVWLYLAIKDYNQVKVCAEKALLHNSEYIKTYYALAQAHEKLGNIFEARKVLEQMLKLDPMAKETIKLSRDLNR